MGRFTLGSSHKNDNLPRQSDNSNDHALAESSKSLRDCRDSPPDEDLQSAEGSQEEILGKEFYFARLKWILEVMTVENPHFSERDQQKPSSNQIDLTVRIKYTCI
jgi:hypothetical protein